MCMICIYIYIYIYAYTYNDTFLEDAGDAPWLNQLLALVQPLALAVHSMYYNLIISYDIYIYIHTSVYIT